MHIYIYIYNFLKITLNVRNTCRRKTDNLKVNSLTDLIILIFTFFLSLNQ